jgi:hypothetical protein
VRPGLAGRRVAVGVHIGFVGEVADSVTSGFGLGLTVEEVRRLSLS